MAPAIKSKFLTSAALGALLTGLAAPSASLAHQLVHADGSISPHQHVYKRSGYGNGFISGHVAPTRHGHNMIIWSPAPSNSYGASAPPQMQIGKPDRQRLQQPQRQQPQIQNLRNLDPRRERR